MIKNEIARLLEENKDIKEFRDNLKKIDELKTDISVKLVEINDSMQLLFKKIISGKRVFFYEADGNGYHNYHYGLGNNGIGSRYGTWGNLDCYRTKITNLKDAIIKNVDKIKEGVQVGKRDRVELVVNALKIFPKINYNYESSIKLCKKTENHSIHEEEHLINTKFLHYTIDFQDTWRFELRITPDKEKRWGYNLYGNCLEGHVLINHLYPVINEELERIIEIGKDILEKLNKFMEKKQYIDLLKKKAEIDFIEAL